MALKEEVEAPSVLTQGPQLLILAGTLVVAEVQQQHMVLAQLLCRQLGIQFPVEGALFVVILRTLRMSVPIVVTDVLHRLHPQPVM